MIWLFLCFTEKMDCPICAETFNRSNRRVVKCHSCFFQACHDCVGKFLLSREEAGCMNCHKNWDYGFLFSQMTKAYLDNPYKEHIKTYLMREVESGLGAYQDVAVLLNKKEDLNKKLDDLEYRLQSVVKQLDNLLEIRVDFHERSYKLYMVMDKKKTPEARQGSLIVRHVQRLVNPPPTEEDRLIADKEIIRLEGEKQHFKAMYLYSLLCVNIYYTDRVLIGLSSDILSTTLTEEEKKDCLQKMQETQFPSVENHMGGQFYEKCMHGTDGDVRCMIDTYRKTARNYWKYYYKINHPTEDDYKRMEEDKERYSADMEFYKKQIQKNTWDKEDVYDNFHSGLQHAYNLDDYGLYPLSQPVANHVLVETTLDREEQKWATFIQEHCEEMEYLKPLRDHALRDYVEMDKIIRKTRQKSGKKFIQNCPSVAGCLGKLGEDGRCGLCGHDFCKECMQEIQEGHVCCQDDIETIRELRRNTRPCPKCNVFIYKTEGCDQMWCVQCHATFSWKTGAITHGVVHNPHFYDYRRQVEGSPQRAPGDIPCGGLPNEIEIVNATARTHNYRMFDIWEYCVWLTEKRMTSFYRRFHNVRHTKYRRYSISYLRGKMDKKRLGVVLHQNYMDEIRYSHYYQILETLMDNMAEYFRQYVRGIDTEKDCIALLKLANTDIGNINRIYHMNAPTLRHCFTS